MVIISINFLILGDSGTVFPFSSIFFQLGVGRVEGEVS